LLRYRFKQTSAQQDYKAGTPEEKEILFLKWQNDKKLAWKTTISKARVDDDIKIHEEQYKEVNRLEQLPTKKTIYI
jgi:hypothetical protein